MSDPTNRYSKLMLALFKRHYTPGTKQILFDRREIATMAEELGIDLPKNVGDVPYSFRYRNALPREIVETTEKGYEWIIKGAGRSKYAMHQVKLSNIKAREDLIHVKIPDSTPEIIALYAQSDEQALLAKIRYNRLVDIFLGITTYSLQNHMRTTVKKIGQIEIDEIYVAIDKHGAHYAIPVQAKVGKDRHSVVQTEQDILCCQEKFPQLICKPVSAQMLKEDIIAMFELASEDDTIKVVQERHYRLVPRDKLNDKDLKTYRERTDR